jgi:ATP/maltotriose-dependent transcriptional regulator MalT
MPAKALKPKKPASRQLLMNKLAKPTVPATLLIRKQLSNPLASKQSPRIILLEAPAGYSKTCTVFNGYSNRKPTANG